MLIARLAKQLVVLLVGLGDSTLARLGGRIAGLIVFACIVLLHVVVASFFSFAVSSSLPRQRVVNNIY
jgi:hypothetical protein